MHRSKQHRGGDEAALTCMKQDDLRSVGSAGVPGRREILCRKHCLSRKLCQKFLKSIFRSKRSRLLPDANAQVSGMCVLLQKIL